jgi:multimeric flavodoxin WrbA
MAQAACQGATRASGVHVRLLRAQDAGAEDLLGAQAYLFATPENLASMTGLMKDFFERSYYPVLERIQGRPYASMVCAGSDGSAAARQVERICTGWRLRKVAEPLIVCTRAQTPQAILAPKTLAPAELQASEALGEALANGLALGVF